MRGGVRSRAQIDRCVYWLPSRAECVGGYRAGAANGRNLREDTHTTKNTKVLKDTHTQVVNQLEAGASPRARIYGGYREHVFWGRDAPN